jgi:dimethylargininase
MFRNAIVRLPGANFADGLTTVDLGKPDYALALQQHERYCRALEQCGLGLERLPADLRYPDGTFVEDVAVLTAGCAVITRPGAPSRRDETVAMRSVLARHFGTLSEITAPGMLDGGDICQAGDHFFIGLSERTNEEGARQLAGFLETAGYTASCVDIRGMPELLHLKSGIAYLGDNRLALLPALADRAAFHVYEVVRPPADEQYAANCVRINDYVLVAAGYPRFQSILANLGYRLLTLDVSEYRKMDGGLSCLSLRF